MTREQSSEMQWAEPMPAKAQLSQYGAGWCRLVSWVFAGRGVSESVTTRVHFKASPEAVWNHVMFYEEVPGRPPFILRTVLPHPLRAEGEKTRVGATVRCVYRRGDLIKRITSVEPPHRLQFEVMGQRLGIEGCIHTLGGSYQICGSADESDVVLTTNYLAFLRPRYLWRSLEALLVSQLHRHILRGVSTAFRSGTAVTRPAAESITPLCTR